MCYRDLNKYECINRNEEIIKNTVYTILGMPEKFTGHLIETRDVQDWDPKQKVEVSGRFLL